MATSKKIQRQLIEGKPALIVIDILAADFMDAEYSGIPAMPGYRGRVEQARVAIDNARKFNIPVVFIQEVHRHDLVDFGRELDGVEDVHCLENDPRTALAVEEMGILSTDYVIKKRRYSAFFGTDFEILLRGLKVDTLLLCGGLTDVCVHYTFVDGHQLLA